MQGLQRSRGALARGMRTVFPSQARGFQSSAPKSLKLEPEANVEVCAPRTQNNKKTGAPVAGCSFLPVRADHRICVTLRLVRASLSGCSVYLALLFLLYCRESTRCNSSCQSCLQELSITMSVGTQIFSQQQFLFPPALAADILFSLACRARGSSTSRSTGGTPTRAAVPP